METSEIRAIVAAFIAEEFMYGEDPAVLADDLQLFENQILDSLTTIRLIRFLEESFNFKIKAHEVAESLGTLSGIVDLVLSSQG